MPTARIIAAAAAACAALAFAAPAAAGPSPVPHNYAHPAPSPLRTAQPPFPFHSHPLGVRPGTATKLGVVSSNNWAGFAAFHTTTGGSFHAISAHYTIPAINCSASPAGSLDSQWVGLDGYTSATVEQTGTFAECSGGAPSYFAFYEMYPLPAVTFGGVNPGDAIQVSVTYHASVHQWALFLLDSTTSTEISVSEPCPSGSTCRDLSAETVSETPDGGPPTASLADYAEVGFTHNAITANGGATGNYATTLWTTDRINEVDLGNGDVMQRPSPLEGGQAFTVAALASS